MSITKRLMDLAKANLNALLDKSGSGEGLEDLSDDELEAELERRKERRRRDDAEGRARYSAEEAARARAEERAREAARARGTTPGNGARASSAGSERPRSSVLPSLSDKRLRELYAQLEVPFGAPFEEVKKSFRRLMRKYHPDLHLGNPTKHKTATQLTMSLTQAYNELEQHLSRGRRA